MARVNYKELQEASGDRLNARDTRKVIGQIMNGKQNIGSELAITGLWDGTGSAPARTVVINNPLIGVQSLLLFMPLDANGNAVWQSHTISGRGIGTCNFNFTDIQAPQTAALEYIVIA